MIDTMIGSLLLAGLLAQPSASTQPQTAAPASSAPAAAAPQDQAQPLSEVTTLRAEVYLLRLRELQRQAAELEQFRVEVEQAVAKETGGTLDWTTGRVIPADKGKDIPK